VSVLKFASSDWRYSDRSHVRITFPIFVICIEEGSVLVREIVGGSYTTVLLLVEWRWLTVDDIEAIHSAHLVEFVEVNWGTHHKLALVLFRCDGVFVGSSGHLLLHVGVLATKRGCSSEDILRGCGVAVLLDLTQRLMVTVGVGVIHGFLGEWCPLFHFLLGEFPLKVEFWLVVEGRSHF